MPQALFRGDERYNEAALELNQRAHTMLLPLFQEFEKRDYSIRDIALILIHCVEDLEGEAILSKNPGIFGVPEGEQREP